MRLMPLAILLLLVGPALAGDGIVTTGPLTDAEFMQLVTCGAVPGGPCIDDASRWDDPGNLTVGFGPVPAGYPSDKTALIETALDRAIAAVNDAGSAVKLRRVDHGADPDIAVRPTMFNENDAVSGEPGIADGAVIGAGFVYIYSDANHTITEGTIVIAQDIAEIDIASIVLEELTQALGFIFDIENPSYENVSVFAQDSNTVLTLAGQDAAILRLYYPGE
jgi:Protein of unknown function (DUF2927)